MSSKPLSTLITQPKPPLSKSTTEFFHSQSTINQFISQFFLPKKHDYSENVLEFYSNTHNFRQVHYKIRNKDNEMLYATLFFKSKLQKPPQNCIVYCHGFGSTRLESVHLLKVLTEDIALCCFDFSGSGKSEGDIVTYGAKEKQDINSVLSHLKSLNFKHFILWGRSMGATACLLYSIKYQQHEEIHDRSVVFQIVDSPFYSFERISLELAKKFVSMPYFGTNIVLDMMKKHCASLGQYDPFNVCLSNIGQCKVPTLFIYSETDDIVASENSEDLCSKFSAFYEKIVISQNHNAPRSTETLSEIIKKIQIQLKKCQIAKQKGVVFRSFISNNSNHNKNQKRGIQRSLKKQNPCSSMYDFANPSSINQIPEVGQLKIESKCQTPNTHSTDNFFNKPTLTQNTEYFSQKPISFSALPHRFSQKEYESPFVYTPKTNRYSNFEPLGHHRQSSYGSQNPNSTEGFDNVYQMRKPLDVKNYRDFKRFSSPIQIEMIDNPLTNFSREKILDENSKEKSLYRNGARRPTSTTKKLSISLSKFKDFKQRNFGPANTQRASKEQANKNALYRTGTPKQKQSESSQYISMSLKSMVRPISQCKKEPIKSSMMKTNTPTTKAASVSSSMDNLHFMKSMKAGKISENQEKTARIIENQNFKLKQNEFRRSKDLKKIKSTENIYFDKNVYKYGF